MNLKRVVQSISVLGVVTCLVSVSGPALAKHKKHSRHHKQAVKAEPMASTSPVAYKDYKDYKALPKVCAISQTDMMLDQMNQNIGRSMPNNCNPGWFNRIRIAGGINVDYKFGPSNAGIQGQNYKRVSLNDAYLNIGADVNDWAKAFASITYQTASERDIYEVPSFQGASDSYDDEIHVSEFSAAYSNNVTGGVNQSFQLEQAFITFGNFDVTPIFVQAGKQYADFSRYEIHPMVRSMTQVLSETLATAFKIGFIYQGFNGAAYAFDNQAGVIRGLNIPAGNLPVTRTSGDRLNFGGSLGYEQPSDELGFALGAGWLYDMYGVNDVAYHVNQYNLFNSGLVGNRTPTDGIAAYGDVNSGPFTVSGRYTTALESFSANDLPRYGVWGLQNGYAQGAKPWAAGVQAAYGFNAYLDRNQSIYVGYQISNEAAALRLPKNRYLGGYDIEVWKNANFGVEYTYDNDYAISSGGSGRNYNLVSVRTSVKFG